MSKNLNRIEVRPRPETDPIRLAGSPIGVTLLDFWRWSISDLLSNANRGVLAEFLVAIALGIPVAGAREEWAAFDLQTPEGITVEVKSAAYLQTWFQKTLSRISFDISPTRTWDARTNRTDSAAKRQAQVYVFALLRHTDKATADPLDLDQWEFFVLSTDILNTKLGEQRSISLSSLKKLTGAAVGFDQLRPAVVAAAGRN